MCKIYILNFITRWVIHFTISPYTLEKSFSQHLLRWAVIILRKHHSLNYEYIRKVLVTSRSTNLVRMFVLTVHVWFDVGGGMTDSGENSTSCFEKCFIAKSLVPRFHSSPEWGCVLSLFSPKRPGDWLDSERKWVNTVQLNTDT